jgi:hypothetical protein
MSLVHSITERSFRLRVATGIWLSGGGHFARRAHGSVVVLDCRPVAKFDATAAACALPGWEGRTPATP